MQEPSHYQSNVFKFVTDQSGHGLISALAGSGKTWTIRKCMDLIPRNQMSMAVAFNKSVAEELQRKVPPFVAAKTLHSKGLSMLDKCKVVQFKTSNLLKEHFDQNNRQQRIKYFSIRKNVSKLVGLLKADGYYEGCTVEAVEELADFHGLDLGWARKDVLHWSKIMLDESIARRDIIDYDDMIFMPVVLQRETSPMAWIFVEEYQDMTRAQHDLIKLCANQSSSPSRILAVGDKNQAINGFRGAMDGMMDYFVSDLTASLMPLNICYRCDKLIIKAAQEFVPEIEWAPTAGEGEILEMQLKDFRAMVRPADMVLCRTIAPMIWEVFKMIRESRPAYILGKDIGDSLTETLEELPMGEDTLDALNTYRNKKIASLLNRDDSEAQIAAVHDKVDTLIAIYEAASPPPGDARVAVKSKIDELFSDTVRPNSIRFMTIHKSKGLEADRVFVLRPDLLPHFAAKQPWQQQQERNLEYVAITRARHTLVWVS